MRYPLFGMGQGGKSLTVTDESYSNMYAEVSDDPDKINVAFYNRHGLDLFISFGDTPCRGALELNDFLYIVHRGTLYQINNAGVKTALGTLSTTTGRVSLATNGNTIQIVDGTGYYTYIVSTSTYAVGADADFVPAKTNTWIDGYFITDQAASTDKTKWNRYAWSLDGISYNALDFASAEANPDPIVRVYNDNRELILFGQFTTEFHASNGNLDLPFSRQSVAEWGLAARETVAKMNNSIIYLAKNRMGKTQVIVLNGYTPQAVSNKSMSAIIDSYGDVSNASAFSFMQSGHPFYIISFPTVGKSWMYDATTNIWSKVTYGLSETQYRGLFGATYSLLDKLMVFDYENGSVYSINQSSYSDNGTPYVCELTTRHVFDENYVTIARLIVDMETGVGLTPDDNGTNAGNNPQVMLKVSKNGGRTYAIERWASLGKIGQYLARVLFNRIGRGKDFVFKVRISDPVKRVVHGAYIDTSK